MALDSLQGLSDQNHHENCDVEQSFLIFTAVLTSRKTRITEENLEKVVIVIRNSRSCRPRLDANEHHFRDAQVWLLEIKRK